VTSARGGVERAGAGGTPRHLRRLALRLTLFYGAVIFLLVAGTSSLLYWSLVSRLNQADDQFLDHEVRLLRTLLEPWPAGAAELRQEALAEWNHSQYARLDIRILDETGKTVLAGAGMDRELPARRFGPPAAAASTRLRGRDVDGPDRRQFRVVSARAWAGAARAPFTLQIALDRTREREALAAYRGDLAVALGAFLVLALGAGTWIARQGVQPVRASFARLSRFSADLAHELRTPVNNLRGEIEVTLAHPRTPAEYRATLESALEEAARLGRLVDGLLFLARAENAQVQLAAEATDLHAELERIGDFYRADAEQRGIRLETGIGADLRAPVDRALFQRAIGNLLENALQHTPAGGTIRLEAERERSEVRVRVTDTGPGLAPERLARLFDLEARGAPTPAGASRAGGLGLGLSIVRGILRLHGGAVDIASPPGGGLTVTLRLRAEGADAAGG
jgi:two-component system heavy metal sensor histidine kinase CusS